MPKKMEEALRKQGRKMGLKGEALDVFVYGAMWQSGWKPTKPKSEEKK